MDGGHGQSPIWSNDSNELYYIKRDNPDENEADYRANALVSSVRAIDVNNLTERILVPADGARQLDLSLAPNGDLVFASDRGDVLEVWTVSRDGHLQQVTADGKPKRFPLIAVLGR
jgi:Tol biopolymer transport system component